MYIGCICIRTPYNVVQSHVSQDSQSYMTLGVVHNQQGDACSGIKTTKVGGRTTGHSTKKVAYPLARECCNLFECVQGKPGYMVTQKSIDDS